MDPASVLGVLGTVCQLFQVAMETYDLYLSIKDFGSSFANFRFALNLERQRLKLWAQCMGIDEDSGINQRVRENPDLLNLVRDILTKMNESFNDSNKLLEHYQTGDNSSLDHRSDSRMHHVGRPWQAVKWATHDKKRAEKLIHALTKHNNDLTQLASTAEQSSMRRKWRTEFVVPGQLDLHMIQETATMMGHYDLSKEAESKSFVQQVYRHTELSATLEATRLDTSHESKNTSLVSTIISHTSFERSSHEQPKSTFHKTSKSWEMRRDKLEYRGVAIMADHSRTLGVYHHDASHSEPVLVDWNKCRDDSWRRQNHKAFELRVNNLAQVLNKDLLPKSFPILGCLGYLHGTSTTIGFAYRPPPEAMPGKEPVSLYHLLSSGKNKADLPELGTRFKLAKAITTTIYEFHNIGWLHKNIQPDNIIFWHSKSADGNVDLEKPYLVGFDLARSNQDFLASEKPLSTEREDLYRHPKYKGVQATDFNPAYDYYSLAIVLFEIALWRPVWKINPNERRRSNLDEEERRKSSLDDPDFVHKTIMDAAYDLGRYVGAKYRDAVLSTLQGDFDEVWEAAADNEPELALQKAFQNKVVDAIDYCQA